jgi:hypothetical protein
MNYGEIANTKINLIMQIHLTTEKKGEIERIMRQFEKELSKKEIKYGVAAAINDTLKRSISGNLNKGIKERYNITQKYISRSGKVYPKASREHLFGGISINTTRMPLIAFKPKQKGSSMAVTIHKGKTEIIRNSFVATMNSGHTGVFSRGFYNKHVFSPYSKVELREGGIGRTKSGKARITELYSVSVFGMGIAKDVAPNVQIFMGTYIVDRVEGILKSKVAKIRKN